MIIDCISDLHGNYPELEGGDLLIIAGDLMATDSFSQRTRFIRWLYEQNYRKKVVVAGNHDNWLIDIPADDLLFSSYDETWGEQKSYASYLRDSGTEFEGLKIWGSPWTLTFQDINPACSAFTGTEEDLANKFMFIPDDIDILITHSPLYGILDYIKVYGPSGHGMEQNIGSLALLQELSRVRPKLHVFGHIHGAYGMTRPNLEWLNLPGYPIFVNCSHVNEEYEPVNKAIRVEL